MACRQPAEGRKEGRKVWTEGWRKGVPINNTPRRGATVATPITPIDTRISIRARTNTWLAFETSIRSNISKLPRRYIFLSLRKLSAKRPQEDRAPLKSQPRPREAQMNLLMVRGVYTERCIHSSGIALMFTVQKPTSATTRLWR